MQFGLWTTKDGHRKILMDPQKTMRIDVLLQFQRLRSIPEDILVRDLNVLEASRFLPGRTRMNKGICAPDEGPTDLLFILRFIHCDPTIYL